MPQTQPATHSPDMAAMALHTPSTTSDEIDLGQIFVTLWRSKWWLICAMFFACILGGVYAFVLATPKYSATATVVLEDNTAGGSGLGALVAGMDGGAGALSGLLGGGGGGVETEIEIISSHPILGQLVTSLDLVSDPEFNTRLQPPGLVSQAVTFIRDSIGAPADPPTESEVFHLTTDQVKTALALGEVRGTSIFRVSFLTEDAEKSAAMANELVRIYIEDRAVKNFARNEEFIKRLAGRVAELEGDLQQAENAVKDFNAKTDLLSRGDFQLMNRQLKELRERLTTTQAEHTTLEARRADMIAAREAGDLAALAALSGDSILRSTLDEVLTGNAEARKRFDRQTERVILQTRQELGRAQSQIKALTSTITQVEEKIDAQSGDLGVLMQLTREAGSSQIIYEFFLGRLKGSAGELGISPSRARILSPAIVPVRAAQPRKMLILLMAAMLGLMASAAILLVRQWRYTSILAAPDLETATSLPVLGQMPRIPVRRRSNVLKYLIDKPNSAASEAVRDLRTSLLLSNVDNPPQVIMVTSSLPGEGKTTQSLALARNLAGLGKKVLLIEGDIRNRVFGEYFETPSQRGILSILSGDANIDNAIARIDFLGCDVLIGEQSSANAADVFSSLKFRDMMDALSKRYDAIIIDTPPVLAVPDARVIAQAVDAVLYVVKWDSTTLTQVREGLKLFQAVGIPVTGLVLSQIDTSKSRDGSKSNAELTQRYYQN